MRRCFLSVGAMMLASMLLAQAQGLGPEERYVGIYYTIQEADTLNEKGAAGPAALKYQEAEAALKALKNSYPAWNEKVVNFRLNYVSGKLGPLLPKIQAAASTNAPVVATNAPADATTPATAPGGISADAMKDLQDAISRLTAQNSELQNKLKEALSVQPAAVDPRELAKAEEKIKALEKERDLLKVSLEQNKTIKPEADSPVAQEQSILAEVKAKLAQQIELVASLQKENQLLKTQMATVKPGAGPADLVQELQITKMTLAALQETNIALRTDALIKEKQLEELSKNAVPRSVYTAVEAERDALKKQLVARATAAPPSANDAQLAEQLKAAQAKLATYEAKPVPYTGDELSVLKPTDLKVSVSDATIRKKKSFELPAGTAPIMDGGLVDMDKGRFGDAEKKFLDVLRQDENNLYVLNHVAEAQIEQNHFDDAAKTLDKALALDAQDAAALYVRGKLLFYQQKYDEAFESLSLSSKVEPDKYQTQYWLGRVLIQKGQRGAAETALRKSVQLQPRWGNAHYLLAFIYNNQQPPFKELARWHYREAVRNGYPPNADFEKMLEEKGSGVETAK